MIFLQLFFEFFKTGLFVFGGGLATIPFLQEISEKTGWFTVQQLMDMIAISEATPGPIGVNMATYVGYTVAGIPGGIIATLGLITPNVVIACLIAKLLHKFKDNPYIESAFYGLRPASLALICGAGLAILRLSLIQEGVWKETGVLLDLFNAKGICLAAILFLLSVKFKNAHPLVFLAGSAVVGMLMRF